MITDLKEIEISALNLSKRDKAHLADKLLQSIHGEIDPEIEQAWIDEVQKRKETLESGEASLHSASDVLKEARKEFFKAAEYYDEQVVGLGDVFIDEVENVLNVFEQQPTSGTKITTSERRFLVSRFPYGVIYSVEASQIIIFAVMNLKRKPDYLKHRT